MFERGRAWCFDFSVERKSKVRGKTHDIYERKKKRGKKSGVFYDKLENAHKGWPPPRNLSAILAYSGESTINSIADSCGTAECILFHTLSSMSASSSNNYAFHKTHMGTTSIHAIKLQDFRL